MYMYRMLNYIFSFIFPLKAIISGWGTTSSGGSQPNALQWATVTIWEDSVANGAYGEIAETNFPASIDGSIDSCQVCDNLVIHPHKASSRNLPQGDSGGPLVSLNGDRYELYGVVSYGEGCAASGKPGIYADVYKVRNWIKETMEHGECS